MKFSMRWFVAALIGTVLIAGFLTWWLKSRAQQQEHAREKPQPRNTIPKPQPRITILAEAPGLSPEEVEELVASPIESQVNGVTGVQCVRSASRQGTCSVWVDLGPSTNLFEARQLLMERLQRANLPPGVTPMLAPISFSEREVLLVGVRSTANLKTVEERISNGMVLHTLAERVLRNRLLALPGVSQVVVTGGIRKQYQVVLDPDRLRQFNVDLPQVVEALKKSHTFGAGGNLRRGDQELPALVQTKSTSLQDLEATVIVTHDGVPVRIKDIARVRFGGPDRLGDGAIWTKGEAETHAGVAVILAVLKEPSTDVGKIDQLLSELQQSLPPDTKLERRTFTREDIGVSLQLPPETSRDEQEHMCQRVEATLIDVAEIQSVWRRGNTAKFPGWSDGPILYVALQPKRKRERESILADIRERIAGIPGLRASLHQPMSQQPGCAGLDAQLAVKVFGPDLQKLQRGAGVIHDCMRTVRGVVDLQVEPGAGSAQLQVRVKRDEVARFGVPLADLNMGVEIALHGLVVGEVLDEGQRLDLVVTYDERHRRDRTWIASLPFKTAGGEMVPLVALADLALTGGPVTVCRENMQRRIEISCNVQGHDPTAVLTDIRKSLKSVEETLPPGYRIEYAGSALTPGP